MPPSICSDGESGRLGSGKSSIISLIARFYQPQHGRILVDGHDIRLVLGESLNRQTGLVLQVNYLFSGTVMENIRYGREGATDEDVINAAKDISPTEVGPSWGSQVRDQAIKGLIVFLILVVLFIWAYFREWKMSVGAMVALVHDLVITVGVYAISGFEVTPATVRLRKVTLDAKERARVRARKARSDVTT
mgnify:CR=1 FL=1